MSEDAKALVVDGWPHCEMCGRVLSLVDGSFFSCAKHPGKRVAFVGLAEVKKTREEMPKNDNLILYIYRKKDDWYAWDVRSIGPAAQPLGELTAIGTAASYAPAWGELVARGMAASYDEASVAGHLALQKIKKKNAAENKSARGRNE